MITNKRYSSLIIRYTIPAIFLVFIFLCSRIPTLAEWYMQTIYPLIATGLSFFSRLVPFSLLDIPLVLAIILLVVSIVMMCRRKLPILRWLNSVTLIVLWTVVWFYMAWGIAYFRPGFHERFGIDIPTEDKEFFESFVERYIERLNASYIPNPYFHARSIDTEIEYLFFKHHEKLRLPYPNGWRRVKRSITTPLINRMGILGYYNPWFNEIQVNHRAPILTYPYTVAHEKAHQFGIAHEDECNLIATIITTSSTHPLVRYSGYLQTVRYLLGNLRTLSPERYSEIVAQIDPRVMADYQAIREHWQESIDSTLSAMQERVYDAYLRANQQQSGILSYSEMVQLLIAWDGVE